MSKTIKLSDKQKEILGLMKNGCELTCMANKITGARDYLLSTMAHHLIPVSVVDGNFLWRNNFIEKIEYKSTSRVFTFKLTQLGMELPSEETKK